MAPDEAPISILQIDGATVLHTAFVPSGGSYAITDRAVWDLGDSGAAGILRDFAGACHVDRENLYMILPRHAVTVRVLTLPSQDPTEIASMVGLTAGEFVPYAPESTRVMHQVLADLPGGESRVLLVLADGEAIDRHVALLRAASLEPRQILLSTTCIQAAVQCVQPPPDGDFATLHVGPRSLEVTAFRDGSPVFSRGAAHDSDWDLEIRPDREALSYEARDALAAYRRESEDGQGAALLLASADGGTDEALLALLRESTGKDVLPVVLDSNLIADPEHSCSLVEAGALEIAAGRVAPGFTLLPENLARDRALRGAQQRFIRIAAAAAVVLAALAAWFTEAVVQRAFLVRDLEARDAALAPRAGNVAAKQQRLQLISQQVDRKGSFLELLSAVASAAPTNDFNITRVEYDREEGMNIWGRARTKDLVLSDFLGNLRALGEGSLSMLARAHSQYETAGRERNQAIFNFQVTIPAVEPEEPDGRVAADQ